MIGSVVHMIGQPVLTDVYTQSKHREQNSSTGPSASKPKP